MKKNFVKIFATAALTTTYFVASAFSAFQIAPPQYNEGKTVLSQIPTVQNEIFQAGEELNYKIYYYLSGAWVGAGEVNFKVEDAGDKYKIMASGWTYGSYDWFFKVRDYYETLIDKRTLLPVKATRTVNEGGYKLFDQVSFDQTGKSISYERGRTNTTTDNKGTRKLSGYMHDVLSAVYYTRTMNFDAMQSGETFGVKVMLDEEEYPLSVKYLGKERKKIRDNGTHQTIKFSPQVVAGQVFKEGSQMKIWASDDANRVPLSIESPVSVGSVRVVLKSYKGLKRQLTSKVE